MRKSLICLFQAGILVAGLGLFSPLASAADQSVQFYLDTAKYFADLQEFERAESFLTKGLTEYPEDLKLLIELSGLYRQQKKHQEEVLAQVRIVKKDPTRAANWGRLGELNILLKLYPAAVHAYQKALAVEPQNPRYQQGLNIAQNLVKTMLDLESESQALIKPTPSPRLDPELEKLLTPLPSPSPLPIPQETPVPIASSGPDDDLLGPEPGLGETEVYQRKYISFFQTQLTPLNRHAVQWFLKDLPRFNYNLIGSEINGDLLSFLKLVKRYQQENAGQMAATQEKQDAKIGDKVIPWSETQRIMRAAYVFNPDWSYSPIKVTGPHLHKTRDKGEYYAIHVNSTLKLNLNIFKLLNEQPEKYAEIPQTWDLTKEIVVGSSNSEYLSEYKPLEQENPARYMLPTALKVFEEEKKEPEKAMSYLVITEVKKLEDFILKGDVRKADMPKDDIRLGFGEKETPRSLGVNLDDGYKIWETRQVGGKEQKQEVGFMKVRGFLETEAQAQPIIVGRDFEMGDQIKEYPKAGILPTIRLGTTAVGLGGSTAYPVQGSWFVPQASYDTEYNMARLLGISELYNTLHFSMNWPVNYPINRFRNTGVISGLIEVGTVKRFYLRQWIFSAGIRGGYLIGALINHPDAQTTVPTQASLGITPTLGIHYQATPDLMFGLDLGARIYPGFGLADKESWEYKEDGFTRDVTFPMLSSVGPYLTFFGNYIF
ncbi:MAG: hypothetical protein IV090_22790 [Candidatus Sericytochromatia bacterium]|nr:hypothetical protein [Candidatus Sericytochromatia bacterium]